MSETFKSQVFNTIKNSGIINLALKFLQPSQSNDNKIHFKSELLEEAAVKKGLKVDRLSNRLILININGRELLFDNMDGPSSSNAIKNLCDNKYITRKLLQEKQISTPESALVKADDFEGLKMFTEKNGYPVVLKPLDMSQGKGVITGIHSEEELKKAQNKLISLIMSKNKKIIIEKEFEGLDYRVYGVNGKILSITERRRPNVVGDGFSTIKELIIKKNNERAKNRYLKDYLIPTDYEKLDNLKNKNISLSDIPNKDELVILRTQSNLSGGGDSIDFTHKAHPEYVKIAKDVLRAMPEIKYCGIDFMTQDITEKPTENNYIVTEIEFSPGPVSMFPIKGQSYDMASEILNYYLENY